MYAGVCWAVMWWSFSVCLLVYRGLLGSHVMVIHSVFAGVLLGSHVMVIHSVFAGACWVVLWWSFTMCLHAYQVIHNVFLVTHNVRVRIQGFAGWSHDGHSQCVCVYAGICWVVMWWSFTMCLCVCRGLLGGHVMVIHNVPACIQGSFTMCLWSFTMCVWSFTRCVCVYAGACWAVMWWPPTSSVGVWVWAGTTMSCCREPRRWATACCQPSTPPRGSPTPGSV